MPANWPETIRNITPNISYVVLVIIFWAWGIWLHEKRRRAKSGQVKLAEDSRPLILYLRSFAEDDQSPDNYRLLKTGGSREVLLADVLNEVGPFVAIGKPSESLPPLGAARIYVVDEVWKREVRQLIKAAGLIIVAADTTDGLTWEISEVISNTRPERVLVALPYGSRSAYSRRTYSRQRQVRYQRFKAVADRFLPVPLPREVGNAVFLSFDAHWTAEKLGPPAAWKALVFGQFAFSRVGFTETLRPYFLRSGVSLSRRRTLIRAAFVFPFLGILQMGLFSILSILAIFLAIAAVQFFEGVSKVLMVL